MARSIERWPMGWTTGLRVQWVQDIRPNLKQTISVIWDAFTLFEL
jgi:hypothetical protein